MRRWVSALPEMVFAVNEERLQRTGIQHYVLSSNSFDNFLSQFQDANPVRAGGPAAAAAPFRPIREIQRWKVVSRARRLSACG